MPALASANSGTISSEVYGWSRCSRSSMTCRPLIGCAGVIRPRITPAIVACTPEESTATQATTPINEVGEMRLTSSRCIATTTRKLRTLARSQIVLMSFE